MIWALDFFSIPGKSFLVSFFYLFCYSFPNRINSFFFARALRHGQSLGDTIPEPLSIHERITERIDKRTMRARQSLLDYAMNRQSEPTAAYPTVQERLLHIGRIWKGEKADVSHRKFDPDQETVQER